MQLGGSDKMKRLKNSILLPPPSARLKNIGRLIRKKPLTILCQTKIEFLLHSGPLPLLHDIDDYLQCI